MLKWADTKKASEWLTNHASDVHAVGLSNRRIANLIKTYKDSQFLLQKEEESDNNSDIRDNQKRSLREDRDYMDAVEKGDEKKAGEMVREAFDEYLKGHSYSRDDVARVFGDMLEKNRDGYDVFGIRFDNRLLVPDEVFPHSRCKRFNIRGIINRIAIITFNNMKRILFYLLFMVFAIGSFATAQEGDIVYINGERWGLLGKPIDDNAILHKALLDFLPEDRITSTADCDGYTAYWSVRNHWLCLDSIKVIFMNWDTNEEYQKCIPAADLRSVFKFYYNNQHIVATWFSRRSIRAGKGNVVYYEHTGYERNTEYELIMTVNKGKVDIQNTFHNRVAVDGFSFTSHPITKDEMRTLFPLQVNQYPELKDVNRIMFSFENLCVDSSRNLINCEVTALVWNFEEKKMKNVESIAKDMKKMLMDFRPWKTLYIHGQYIPEDKNGYTIPYYLDK